MASGSGAPFCSLNKPAFSQEQAAELVERVFGLKVSKLKPLPSYDDQNFHVRVAESEGKGENAEEYVLKIINCEDSRNPELIEVQTQIMMFLNKEGFPVPTPRFTKEGALMFLESVETPSGTKAYMVRLLSYLPGQTVATVPVSPRLLYEIGQLAARLDKTFTEKFEHPLINSLHRGDFIWNLANLPLLKPFIHSLGPGSQLEVVKEIIEQFTAKIAPKLRLFRPSINHGDLNDHNILVDKDSASPDGPQFKVSGILDFSDMSYGYYVFEVAIAIMYMMIESRDPLSVGGHVLAGFESVIPLTPEERGALFLLVCGRFTQSLVMAAHTSLLHPENKEYLMITAKTGWKQLMILFEMGQEAVEKIWFETAKKYST
uniref:Hydroxylysine kinase n=1 Tax=Pogona vitticeps TaxID=103695 RepID=A0ABM5EZ34_9SAUR